MVCAAALNVAMNLTRLLSFNIVLIAGQKLGLRLADIFVACVNRKFSQSLYLTAIKLIKGQNINMLVGPNNNKEVRKQSRGRK